MLDRIHLSQVFPLNPEWAVPSFSGPTLGIFQGQFSSFTHELLSLSKRWVCSVCSISDIVFLPSCLYALIHDRLGMPQNWHGRFFISAGKYSFESTLQSEGKRMKDKINLNLHQGGSMPPATLDVILPVTTMFLLCVSHLFALIILSAITSNVRSTDLRY